MDELQIAWTTPLYPELPIHWWHPLIRRIPLSCLDNSNDHSLTDEDESAALEFVDAVEVAVEGLSSKSPIVL